MTSESTHIILDLAKVAGWVAFIVIVTSGDPDIIDGIVHLFMNL